MKHAELKRHTSSSIEKVKLACFKYIEGFCNPKRAHSTIYMLSLKFKRRNLLAISLKIFFSVYLIDIYPQTILFALVDNKLNIQKTIGNDNPIFKKILDTILSFFLYNNLLLYTY